MHNISLFSLRGALVVVFYAALVLCLASAPVQADNGMFLTPLDDSEATPPPLGQETPKWHLAADKLTTLAGNTIVEAEGQVVLIRGDDILKADFARYYSETDWIYLKGNVFVRMGRDDINAESAEFDLRSKTGWLTNGDVFMEGQHTYFKGERIIKHFGDRYTFRQAKVTTCDGNSPAWTVTADEAVVELDGYAQLFHSSFLVKSLNVFYSPFMILPAKTTRQSGLLPPDYGLSDQRGAYYTQPYYWVINETSDMTFYGGFMTKRGPLVGVEYRSHPFSGQKTWLGFTGVHDSQTVDSPGDNSVYPHSGLVRTNRERFWLRGMADGFIGNSGWRYRGNIDFVSDQDYLREFGNGPTGFRRSRNQLFEMFGRDLNEDDQNRVSMGMVYRDWERFGLVGSLRYQQNPALGHGNLDRSQDSLVQELPRLDAFLYKGFVIPGFKYLEAEAQFSTSYMYRRAGTSGLRSEIFPTFSVPTDLGFLSVIGSAGVRQTWYSNTSTADNSPFSDLASGGNPRQTSEARTIPQFEIKAFTEANRVWDLDSSVAVTDPLGSNEWVAVRHQLQPRLRYNYTANINQERNPFYSADDRVLSTNEVTASLSNIVTRKRATVAPGEDVEGQPGTASIAFDYLDLIRWRIESGYDFNEAKRTNYRDEYDRRPFMDVLSDLEFRVVDWAGYGGKIYVSPYDGEVTRQDHGVYFSAPGWGMWSVGVSQRSKDYDYRRRLRYENRDNIRPAEPVRLLYNTIYLNLGQEWGLSIADKRNMREGGKFGRSYEQDVQLSYTAQCYKFIAQYRSDSYEKSFTLMVELPGLFD